MPDWTELLEKKLEELPDGVAVWFVHDKLHPDTICFLVRAEGKMNHKFPPLSKLEILETGIAFFNPHDNKEDNINAKGELMALGRALKSYHHKENTTLEDMIYPKLNWNGVPGILFPSKS